MNRALFAGLSGTIAFQNRLDVVATNLANATTTGYKEGRVTFQDALYQTLRGGRAGSDVGLGGLNPMQIGSGVTLGTIQVQHNQGSLERTGQALDAAIEGAGMFVLSDGSGNFYARDGAFVLDSTNTLVGASSGYKVQGWMAVAGEVDATGPTSDLVAHSASVAVSSQDGRPAASLVSLIVGENGLIEGQFSDGRSRTLAQLALANFPNPGGLRRVGSNLYEPASAAGSATVGPANTGGRGRVVGQALEMSNVDLTRSFVDMITTQRGFQASTRVIASANEMLDDVVRLIKS